MIIFRPHRGSLQDSMKESKEFNSRKDLTDYIFEDWQGLVRREDIVISYENIHNDDRINWRDVHYICINGIIDNDGSYKDYKMMYGAPQCIGMCSENYGDK